MRSSARCRGESRSSERGTALAALLQAHTCTLQQQCALLPTSAHIQLRGGGDAYTVNSCRTGDEIWPSVLQRRSSNLQRFET